MKQFFFGLGLATGGGLTYFVYLNPEIGYVILAGAMATARLLRDIAAAVRKDATRFKTETN